MTNSEKFSRRKLLQLGGAGVVLSSLFAKNNAVAGKANDTGKANANVIVMVRASPGLARHEF